MKAIETFFFLTNNKRRTFTGYIATQKFLDPNISFNPKCVLKNIDSYIEIHVSSDIFLSFISNSMPVLVTVLKFILVMVLVFYSIVISVSVFGSCLNNTQDVQYSQD